MHILFAKQKHQWDGAQVLATRNISYDPYPLPPPPAPHTYTDSNLSMHKHRRPATVQTSLLLIGLRRLKRACT